MVTHGVISQTVTVSEDVELGCLCSQSKRLRLGVSDEVLLPDLRLRELSALLKSSLSAPSRPSLSKGDRQPCR